jgi:predicted RNase H-like HicB family nuclease
MEAMQLKVELFYDNEVKQWGYTVPALSILGTGCNSREEAERFAVEAIQEVIESGDEEIEEGAEVMTLDVQIAKAS